MPNVMATQPNIDGALCESSVIPFLVRRHKVLLMPTARVWCSNAANIAETRVGSKVNFARGKIPLWGKSTGKCIYSVPVQEMAKHLCEVWLTSVEWRHCSNKAKTRKPLKFAGVAQTRQQISAIGGPKFIILCGHEGKYCCLRSVFRTVNTCLSCGDIAQQSEQLCQDGKFLCPAFPVSRVQHISDLHSKFALGPHSV